MTETMNYKGYTAKLSFDDAESQFYGDVLDVNDVIVFYGTTAAELRSNFHSVVDAYLDACAEDGVEPDRPYSGKIQLRMGPDLHRQLARDAAIHNVSLNEWIVSSLRMRTEALHSDTDVAGQKDASVKRGQLHMRQEQ